MNDTGTCAPGTGVATFGDHTRPALRRRELMGVAVVGVAVDVAVRSEGVGLMEAVAFALMAFGVLASGRLSRRQAQVTAALAIAFAAWSVFRASPWLVPLDLLAASLLLVVSVGVAREGDLTDLTVPRILARIAVTIGRVVAVPGLIAVTVADRGPGDRTATLGRVVRGMALAGPLVVVLAVLLASADAVFAHLLRMPVDPGEAGGHLLVVVAGAWAMAGLFAAASRSTVVDLPPRRPVIGATEAVVVLASMVGVFSLFAVAQLVALTGSGRHVIATAGLTYAEYARTGYFQLLAVAAVTLTVLVGLRALTDLRTPAGSRLFRTLAHAAIALTIVVVVVALRRLDLYEDAFGLTMLRLYGVVFAWWLAVVFGLLAVAVTARGSQRGWFPLGAVATGLLALFALNVVNPEATVVRRNLDHFERTGRFDAAYLGALSADGVPALVDGLDRLPPAERAQARAAVCRAPRPERGLASFNVAHERARRALATACPGR